MVAFNDFLHQLREFLNITIFQVGGAPINISDLLYFVIATLILFIGTARAKTWIVHRVLARSSVDIGVRTAVASIFRYMIIFVGMIILIQTMGVDLSTVTVLAGALGIGIGFGLQNITTNFISGIIILFERPVKVGDRIEVEGTSGDVVQISPRATTILTNDNIAVIVPNSEFISSRVINWSYTDRNVRFNFPVGVAYRSDPELVREALMEVALEHDGVLKDPEPDVLLEEFGDSSLNFTLRVWTGAYTTRPGVLRSELNYRIFQKFKERGIEIPFPQRDLHVRTVPEALLPKLK